MRLKTLIIGDSLSLPRAYVAYEDTWPILLGEMAVDHQIIVLSRRGLTSKALVTEGTDGIGYPLGSDFLEFYKPKKIIIQLGIVDCYPRHFRESGITRKILSLLPSTTRDVCIQFLKKIRGPKANRSFVSPTDFEKHFEIYLRRAEDCGVNAAFLIKIAPISDEKSASALEARSQIAMYNAILSDVAKRHTFVQIIDPFESSDPDPNNFLSDGYHLSTLGHKRLAEKISKVL